MKTANLPQWAINAINERNDAERKRLNEAEKAQAEKEIKECNEVARCLKVFFNSEEFDYSGSSVQYFPYSYHPMEDDVLVPVILKDGYYFSASNTYGNWSGEYTLTVYGQCQECKRLKASLPIHSQEELGYYLLGNHREPHTCPLPAESYAITIPIEQEPTTAEKFELLIREIVRAEIRGYEL